MNIRSCWCWFSYFSLPVAVSWRMKYLNVRATTKMKNNMEICIVPTSIANRNMCVSLAQHTHIFYRVVRWMLINELFEKRTWLLVNMIERERGGGGEIEREKQRKGEEREWSEKKTYNGLFGYYGHYFGLVFFCRACFIWLSIKYENISLTLLRLTYVLHTAYTLLAVKLDCVYIFQYMCVYARVSACVCVCE